MFSRVGKWAAGMALLNSVANADRYLTEIEELIMQVKRDTDGKEHISWKESITEKLQHSKEFSDKVKHELLIPRLGNHYSYHDAMVVIEQLKREFPDYINVSSFGKTYEGRDIPLIRLQKGNKPTTDRPAMLLTGAHHAREAVSIQMPFYIIFKFLHGALHNDQYYLDLLENVTLYVVPMLNVDGVYDIEQTFFQTADHVMKRKNKNDSWGGKWLCGDDTYTGVDLNRNYGFSHGNFGAKEDPCSESFSGPFPFSEPETRAMRDFIFKHVNEIKFVYNFHSYGNMYVTPFNAIAGDLLQDAYPTQFALFEEILDEGHPANQLKVGTAHDLLGYTSPGEASDWILAATGIAAISPELGTDNPATNSFRLDTPELVIDVLDQQYPIIEKTIEKLQARLEFVQVGHADVDAETKEFSFTVEIRNKGLKDMQDFTIMSAQASVEARFDDPHIQ